MPQNKAISFIIQSAGAGLLGGLIVGLVMSIESVVAFLTSRYFFSLDVERSLIELVELTSYVITTTLMLGVTGLVGGILWVELYKRLPKDIRLVLKRSTIPVLAISLVIPFVSFLECVEVSVFFALWALLTAYMWDRIWSKKSEKTYAK